MNEIELSCGLPPSPDFADLCVLAEDLGYSRMWIFDSAPLLAFEGHVTHLAERDRHLLLHVDVMAVVGDADSIRRKLDRLADAGFPEAIYTPTGPDVVRELRAFAAARTAE